MKVSEAFESGLIPMEYKGIIPEKCQCGCENEITESLTSMWCPNVKCDFKQISRMNKMLDSFGVKSIGYSYCKDLWECMKDAGLDDSHVKVFLLPYTSYPETFGPEVTKKKFNSIQDVVSDTLINKPYTFGDVIGKLGLPNLENNARKLFKGYSSLDEVNEYVLKQYPEEKVWGFVKERFNDGKLAVSIAKTIINFKSDIRLAESLFAVRKSVNRVIKIAITGKIQDEGRFTRKEFLRYVNNLCEGVAEIVDVNPSPQIEFVVADDFSDSSTYIYGEENDLLINSAEFVQWLKDEVI